MDFISAIFFLRFFNLLSKLRSPDSVAVIAGDSLKSALFSISGIDNSVGLFKYSSPFSVMESEPKFSIFFEIIFSTLKYHNKPFQKYSLFDFPDPKYLLSLIL